MAALGEIPFGLYYGSVDSTPLFVWLAGAYVERSGDLETAHRLWPAVERALTWIERHGDLDGDGYVEYSRRSAKGLVNQGWKDSGDAVFHADGTDAEPPITLCEVQGYVYASWLSAARLAEQLGEPEHARELIRRAEKLRERFDADFWDEELGTYVLALDGKKRPCRVRSSNAGQCLWTGIVKEERAPRLVETLLGHSGYSGWGVRTLSTSETRYNPLAYHNGSIWPHDNALVACGLSRYGYKEAAVRILEVLFAAACFFELHRLPEVFCGFPRQRDEGPTRYPVACAPQAWSCGTVYLLLQAILGLSVNAAEQTITFERPRMPGCLAHIELSRLKCGEAEVDLALTRHREGVGVEVTRRDGKVRIIAVK
jgi:glycogen debranching enzyme